MINAGEALAAMVRHAVELEDDHDDIAPTVTALATCGDTTLVPRLCEVLDRFLDEENFYGRDLIAGVLAGIQGVAALPVLLRASARNLGDDQDGLQSEIIELLHADRAAGRRTVLGFATDDTAELRRVGLWALGFVVDARDVELLAAAATDVDPRIRSTAIGSIPILPATSRLSVYSFGHWVTRTRRYGCRRSAGSATPAGLTRWHRWLPSQPTRRREYDAWPRLRTGSAA